MDLKNYVATIENYPKEGILFRDITPLMNNGEAYKYATEKIVEFAKEHHIDIVVGPEARGFIFGCPVSYALGIGFVPVRKPGKLPREVIEYSYDLEYGSNKLCLHKDSIRRRSRSQTHILRDHIQYASAFFWRCPAHQYMPAYESHRQ